MASPQPVAIAALYQFTPFDDPDALRAPLLEICQTGAVKGTLLLAREGINGTIAGSRPAIDTVLAHIHALPGCDRLDVKFSHADTMPFNRMKVRIKREIVTMGEPDIDPRQSVGRYVEPEQWNLLISDTETVVIDTRNAYEVAIGSFQGAVDPQTTAFRDFPQWFQDNRAELLEGRKKVAMFCTGGIRCEKSTSFLRAQGIEEVYHLKGGILKYLENIPESDSLWEGECFVFDERVSVGHGLKPGNLTLCRACRRPLGDTETASPHFVEGISCPHCIDERNDAQRARYAERQHQEELAQQRGMSHIGPDLSSKRA